MLKNRYVLMVTLTVLCGIYLSIFFVNPYKDDLPLSEMILQLSGSSGTFELGFSFSELMSFSMCLFPYFFLELFAGIIIYRYFCVASIYVFSRYPYRIRWSLNKAGELLVLSFLCNAIILSTAILISAFRFHITLNKAGLLLTFFHYLIYSLWIYIMVMLINVLSIYMHSSGMYALVVGAQMIAIVFFGVTDIAVRNTSFGLTYSKLLVLNPVAHLVMSWHYSTDKCFSSVLENSYLEATFFSTIFVFVIISILITAIGVILISKYEHIEAGELEG